MSCMRRLYAAAVFWGVIVLATWLDLVYSGSLDFP